MTGDPSGMPPPPAPPSPGSPPTPGPGASRWEWRAWRRQVRDYERSQYGPGGWYGPWPWTWHGTWGWFWPAALIVVGAYYLLSNLGLLNWVRGDVLWPTLLILLGVVLILRRGRWW